MTSTLPLKSDLRWDVPPTLWLLFALAIILLGAASLPELVRLIVAWNTQEEYSFGYFIPVITFYLLWQKRGELERTAFVPSWWGPALLLLLLAVAAAGRLAATEIIVQYAFCLAIMALVVAHAGWRGFAVMAVPLAILVFMVPPPRYLMIDLSQWMQLWSTRLGVAVVRVFGISVYMEGNVIDLGVMKLQVVDACSGLRYLMPLAAISFIAAYMFRVSWWKRAIVFASSFPIALLMNSLRIGVIGVLVEYYGKSMAEGFLHDFEGWAVFMVCTAALVAEMALLARLAPERSNLSAVFFVESRPSQGVNEAALARKAGLPLLMSIAMLAAVATVSLAVPRHDHETPDRKTFGSFPMRLKDWRGRPDRMDPGYVEALRFDDYLYANYSDGESGQLVNAYAAYYADQGKEGVKPHSPKGCIPADGWEILDTSTRSLVSVPFHDKRLQVNRVLISKGDTRQLVYYWFQERGRNTVDEHLIKFEILWDQLTRNRADGALVRVIAFLKPGQAAEEGDAQLEHFAQSFVPALTPFIPE